MKDIKVTLSTNLAVRAPSIEDEADWVRREGTMRYPLNQLPCHAGPGCWVYFIRAGEVVARARAVVFEAPGKGGSSYTGIPQPTPPADVKIEAPMEVLKPGKRLECRGFQGYRYVTSRDQSRFFRLFT